MSATDPAPPTPPRAPAAHADWPRVALACAVLLGSGGARLVQARRVEGRLVEGRRGPRADLAGVPLGLGPWRGEPTTIDPRIALATGADQVVTRRYVNQETGVALDVILLYGPAVDMFIHAPEHCYPSAGFALAAGPEDRSVAAGARFRSLVYGKGEGGRADLQEVYFSWWYAGRWSPDAGAQKHFERIPSMYKVQLARRVNPTERRDVGNPCEAFLGELLPELGRRMAATGPPRPSFERPSRSPRREGRRLP